MSKIWYKSEAKDWNEALPIGNGMLGAMVFGRTGQERIQLNEDSLWSGGPMNRVNPDALGSLDKVRSLLFDGDAGEAERLARQDMFASYPHMRHYQTLGDVWLDFTSIDAKKRMTRLPNGMTISTFEHPECINYRRELDLETSIGAVDFTTADGVVERREYFASAPDNVLVYRLERDGGPLSFELSLSRRDNHRGCSLSYCDGAAAIDDHTVHLWGSQGGEDGISFELVVRVLSRDGLVHAAGSHLVVENSSHATILITARTTFRSDDPLAWCLDALDKTLEHGYAGLRGRAISDYRRYFDACHLAFGSSGQKADLSTSERIEAVGEGAVDTELVSTYFDYSRYLLISSSRPGSLPATLQGIWNEDFNPKWGSRYTLNINTEMNYWLAERTGLSDMQLPLLEHVKRMEPSGCEVARTMYGARGFCAHHNTDIWGDCAPADVNDSATLWPMGAAWLCLHIVEHYRFTHDEAFLDEYLPVLRESIMFFIDYLVQDSQGFWVTGPSVSPENSYELADGTIASLCMGPTMDISILRELFSGYLELAAWSDDEEDRKLTPIVEERLAGLPPLRIGGKGQIQEWGEDYREPDPGHRHVSQLFALYPAEQIRVDRTPELAEAARTTLERRLDNGGGLTGWSRAWIALLWTRLDEGERAWESLQRLLGASTLPNLLDNHPPFQIDGNFGGGAAILEMLVRDYGETVQLLPALPEALDSGEVSGVRLRCGCVLDMEWRAGKLVDACIQGLRDGRVSFQAYGGGMVDVVFMKGETKRLIL